jgi:hypothetical protein
MQTQDGGEQREEEGGGGRRGCGRGVHRITTAAVAAAVIAAAASPRHEGLKQIPANGMQHLALGISPHVILISIPSNGSSSSIISKEGLP